ncbi:MAG: hypothetical protein HYR85_09665 [Planctomycetes bacterium]|nr:hypothetical protein [Planctomycetota bacterium]MBI3847972.1 hypothetical protein [Planctomycetota bacterium]
MTVGRLRSVDVKAFATVGAVFGAAYGAVVALFSLVGMSIGGTVVAGLGGAILAWFACVITWALAFGFLGFAINFVGAKTPGVPFRFEPGELPFEESKADPTA